jgi:hypothetical protein
MKGIPTLGHPKNQDLKFLMDWLAIECWGPHRKHVDMDIVLMEPSITANYLLEKILGVFHDSLHNP